MNPAGDLVILATEFPTLAKQAIFVQDSKLHENPL
jgi:hypothetical protein